MKYSKETGYGYYPFNTLFMMINMLYIEHKDSKSIPWEFVTILFKDLDDPPTA